jgi:peptide/nickel transport system substrate-binding protein
MDIVGSGSQLSRASQPDASQVSRRRLLLGAAGVGAAIGMGGLLSGCSSSGGAKSAAATKGLTALAGGTPVRGGTLTAGVITAGSAENLFPGTSAGNPDMSRVYNLYNFLFYPNSGSNLYPVEPGLALSAEPNKSATLWTIRLRDNVIWHDGKPFTAEDVVYNFRVLWGDSASNYSSGFLVGLVDFKNVRALDRLTVEVPLLAPSAEFPSILGLFNFGVLPVGATPKSVANNPIGTGPFKFKSFTPGQQSVFVANKDYWEEGKPYVDQLIVNSTFTDNTALVNAMMGGTIDLVIAPSLTQARAQINSAQVQVLQSASATQTYMFGMRVDAGPFADNRVREGFKYLVDRQAMINGALSGFGEVAYDLLGPYCEHYAKDLKREHDVDKAASLFKQAGVAGQTFKWPTANVFPGMVESATILADQAKAAGIKIEVDPGSPGTYFTPAGGAYTRMASQNVMQPSASLTANYRALLTVGAPYADTHWGLQKPSGAAANALIGKAIAATDTQAAQDLWLQVQQQQAAEGGYVVWGNLPYIDFAGKNVRGLKASGGLNFNMFRFCDGWKV